MATPIRICLTRSEWDRLERHLPEGICEKVTEHEPGDPIEDCRLIANEATYRAILAIAHVHCPDLVPTIEKEKDKSDIEALPPQGPVAVPSLARAHDPADMDDLASSVGRNERTHEHWLAMLVLTFLLVELSYLAFFASCVPLLTGRGRCQRPSLSSAPLIADAAGVTWSMFLNATGFVFDIFSVYCLLAGGAVWRETVKRPRSVGPVEAKRPPTTIGSIQPLSICGVILLTLGVLLHVAALFL